LGADIIKSDPTADPGDYHKVVRIAGGIPVLVRGGGKVDDTECLRRTEAVLAQGASGIVYGRNIIQHPKPDAMVKALLEVVHDGIDTRTALKAMDSK
jgi:class I fructose-bisphosphate aldolase